MKTPEEISDWNMIYQLIIFQILDALCIARYATLWPSFCYIRCYYIFVNTVATRCIISIELQKIDLLTKTCFSSNLVTPWPFYFDYSLLSSFSSPSQLVGFQTIIESNYVLSSGDKICASCRSINMLQCKTWIRLVEP